MNAKVNVVLVLLGFALCALLALGLKWVNRARSKSSYASCVALLGQIDGAVLGWALDHKKTTNDVPTWDDLVCPDCYMSDKPVCPQGGEYTLRHVGEHPQCSIPMHSLDFGWVAVTDESGAPISGAALAIEGVTLMGGESALTDTNGHALLTHWPSIVVDDWSRRTARIAASLPGYETGRVSLPTGWPTRIILKKAR
jgi:hypothetical protein